MILLAILLTAVVCLTAAPLVPGGRLAFGLAFRGIECGVCALARLLGARITDDTRESA